MRKSVVSVVSVSLLGVPFLASPAGSAAPRAEATTVATTLAARADWPHDLKKWDLRWQENFNRINPKRWNVRHRTYNSNEHSYLLADNVSIWDGKLRIQGKKQSAGGRDYTSGYVDTNGKFSVPNYFRVKIRAKVPMEQGLWAAPLWFRPADYSGGEIDLIETYGREGEAGRPIIHQTIHTDYGSSHRFSGKPTPYQRVGDSTGTKWHTYVVKKVPGRIVMKVDGVRTAVWRQGDPDWFNRYYEAGKRWNMRINLQIGGSYGGLPDGRTDWSPRKSRMLVDYVYVWTRK